MCAAVREHRGLDTPTDILSTHGTAERFRTAIQAESVKNHHHHYDHTDMRQCIAPALAKSTLK